MRRMKCCSVYSSLVLVGFLTLGLAESTILRRVYSEYGHRNVCSVESSPAIIDVCDVNIENGQLPTGSRCRLIDPYDGTTYLTACLDGRWLISNSGTTTTNLDGYRQKRFLGMIFTTITSILLGAAVDFIVCELFCSDNNGGAERIEVVNRPPQFTDDCPTISGLKKTAKGSISVIVTWKDPTAVDPEKDKVKISQSFGMSKGSDFNEGTHNIVYLAEDSKGNKDYCFMSFTVVVLRCTALEWPQNGHKQCDGNDYFGSTCTFTCNEGYELQGHQSITCEEDGFYSQSSPTCSRVKCLAPDEPEHGHALCSKSDHSFGSICWSRCEIGYMATIFKFSQCMENKMWSNPLSTCYDIQPPRITCPSMIKAYADRNSNTANVTWVKPIATDNAGDATVELIDSNKKSGSLFQIGYTPVSYQAVDKAGNISPKCTLTVIVEILSCPPPAITDNYIAVDCPPESLYQWGSMCSLSCLANLPLKGSDTITCERVNDTTRAMWTSDMHEEPYCQQIDCPVLDPPLNGALACDSGIQLKWCNLQCNEHYDISSRVPKDTEFVCGSSGTWSPAKVPDCSEARSPESMVLPSEIYYYGGTCDTDNEEIRNNFVAQMEEIMQTVKWAGICDEISCDIDNIEIYCGITESKKRDVEATYTLKFMIVVNVGEKAITRNYIEYTEDVLNQLAEAMRKEVDLGSLNIDGLQLRQNSFLSQKDTEWRCPYGQSTEMSKFYDAICVGCPVGTYFDGQDDCLNCPIGTYRDKEDKIDCTDCPKGKWTSHDGAVNASSCLDICQSGSYSLTGLAPCSPCPVGEFQSAAAAQNCIVCPPGKTTQTYSTKTVSECLDFDILMNPSGLIYVEMPETEADGWTMATWLYSTAGDIDIYFGELIIINYSTHWLVITIRDTTVETAMVAATEQWIHIAVRMSFTVGSTDVFVNGKLVESMDTFSANSISASVSYLKLLYNGPEKNGMIISGFNFMTSSLTDDTIRMLSVCNAFEQNADATMSDLSRGTNTNVELIVPTKCDAYDDCQDEPCGKNGCENEQNGYVCDCSGGFSGDHCEIPPDYCVDHKCQNGATCRSRYENYTCDCLPGYSGEMCQDAPINGQWGEWGDWSVCTVTCGGGTMSRQRFCDNPPPNEYGLPCQGEYYQDHMDCNLQDCPSCTDLARPYASVLRCEDIEDMTYCNLTCRVDYTFPPGHTPKQIYECGIKTGYEWQHTTNDNPLGELPMCSKIGQPRKLSTKTEWINRDLSCDKEADARRKLIDNMEGLPCVSNATCSMDITLNGCGQAKRKRRASNNITWTMTLTVPIIDGDLGLASFFENNTVTETLAQLIQDINELEMSAQALQDKVHIFLDIDIDGTTYYVDADTVTTIPDVNCLEGSVPVEAFCVECTPGTFFSDGHCVLCGKGTYQDQSGQSSCIQCPDEKTTPGTGSVSITYCNMLTPTTPSVFQQTTSGSKQETNEGEVLTSTTPTIFHQTTSGSEQETNEGEVLTSTTPTIFQQTTSGSEQETNEGEVLTSTTPSVFQQTTSGSKQETKEGEDNLVIILIFCSCGFVGGVVLVLALCAICHLVRKRSRNDDFRSFNSIAMVRPVIEHTNQWGIKPKLPSNEVVVPTSTVSEI